MDKRNGIKTDCKVSSVTPLSKQKITEEYILQSAVNIEENGKLAVTLSTHEILLFDVETKAKTLSFKGHQNSITGIKFSRKNPNMLFTSSIDGNIYAWDSRKGITPAQTYLDDTDGYLKPLLCFDMNISENYICAGTELIKEDSFIIFWDQRTAKTAGGYWNSHTDEIIHVQFHSECDSGLASSSEDGLINIYDLTQGSEEDALTNVLNTGNSVNRFSWSSEDFMSCTTRSEEYQFWSTEQTAPTLCMSKTDLSEKFQCQVDYLIDTFIKDNSLYLATGSNNGHVQLYQQKGKKLKQIAVLENGHSDVVRTVTHSQNNYLITGGEDGQLCTWKISL